MSQSVDDRTEEERDPRNKKFIDKSRYSAAYTYISENIFVQDRHNDNQKFDTDKESYDELIKNNIPKRLAEHFCNLMIRDPLVVFDEKIDIEESDDYSHFENFQSTNWNTLRFKPPRLEDEDFCFKVEVRVPEISLTPYENSAFTTFIIIYSRLVYKYEFNNIIPISLVNENYDRAVLNDAVTTQKFWFRTNGLSLSPAEYCCKNVVLYSGTEDKLEEKLKKIQDPKYDSENIHELSVLEILCGCEKYEYKGLFWLMNDFIDKYVEEEDLRKYYRNHLDFIRKRATGIVNNKIRRAYD